MRLRSSREKWTHYHLRTFFLTFVSFALIHALRKTLAAVKPSVISSWRAASVFETDADARQFLALLDSSFLTAYSLGLYLSGMVGDRFEPRLVLSTCMFLSAACTFVFGYLTEVLGVYNKPLYVLLWVLCGLFQSLGWPTEVNIMGNWFGGGSRGAVLGVWSVCGSVGNIVGALVSSRALTLGYEYAFAFNSLLLFAFGIVIRRCLINTPGQVGLPDPLSVRDHGSPSRDPSDDTPIEFRKACLLPGVVPYSLAFACVKMVDYGFFFWLPFYLNTNFSWAEATADELSTWYDCGGIVSSVVAGAVSDRFHSRTPLMYTMLLSSTLALAAYANSPASMAWNGALLFVCGMFVSGPSSLIAGTISADLGKSRHLKASALATVTGIVDGTGSLGAALGQMLIPAIEKNLGWDAVFHSFIFMMVLTLICLGPMLYREVTASRQVLFYLRAGVVEREGLLLRHPHEDGGDE